MTPSIKVYFSPWDSTGGERKDPSSAVVETKKKTVPIQERGK